MNVHMTEVLGELLRSAAHNEVVLRELLQGRAETERARHVNYMFMNYLSIIHSIFNIKMGGGRVQSRARIPCDLEFIEMLNLLVRYTNDIATWIEDHDRTGLPWEHVDDFYSESLLQVDMQCQRWWALADMTTFNQVTSPFPMPPPLSPMGESPTQFGTFEAPPTPALSFTKYQSPSTASSNFSCPQDQVATGFPKWDDGGDPEFNAHHSPFTGSNANNDRHDFGASVVQQPRLTMPSTPRLEQQGFVPSPNLTQTSTNKKNGFFQPMPPPARKIAIPRLQKLGLFEPLLPPTQNSTLQPFPTTGPTSISVSVKKRRHTKASLETASERKQKRQAVGSETPRQNPRSTKCEAFTPGLELSPDTLNNDSPSSALTFSGDSHDINRLTSPDYHCASSYTTIPQIDMNNTINKAGITSQQDLNDTVLVAFSSNDEPEDTGLGVSSPPMNHDFTSTPSMGVNMDQLLGNT